MLLGPLPRLVVVALGILQITATPQSVYVSTLHDDLSLRFVRNSGVCETTPGVEQVSGYIDIGKNLSMVRAIM
jgi:hypothetical protein